MWSSFQQIQKFWTQQSSNSILTAARFVQEGEAFYQLLDTVKNDVPASRQRSEKE